MLAMELAWLLFLALCFQNASALLPQARLTRVRFSSSLQAVETLSLKELDNHEEEGSLMGASIVKWLDDEWMPQEVHVRMAESAKQSYISCREAGQDDVTDILMKISDDLHSNWQEYDADAFVNAWDIGNYASDYLIKRSGNEGCACSSQIY